MSDKRNWKAWRFDQMVQNVNERVERPAESGLSRFVGLEHLDSGSLKIRRWGSTSDVEKTKLLFKKGDIIFGRRNAYLKRVAVADFDGVCSAHALVLRARKEVVSSDFLPYFMQTATFWDTALRVSAGSMSPTINWSNIAKEEFALPPLEVQQKLALALCAADHASEHLTEAKDATRVLLMSAIDSYASNCLKYVQSVENLISDGVLAPPQDGNHGEKHPKAADYIEDGIPFLMAADIRNGKVELDTCKFIAPELAETLRIGFAREGDVLLTHKGTVGLTAILYGLRTPYAMLTPQVTFYRVRAKEQLMPKFLYYMFHSSNLQQQLSSFGRQSTRAYVGIVQQRKLLIPVPPSDIQDKIVTHLQSIEHAEQMITERQTRIKQVLAQLRTSELEASLVNLL
jgi:type I restriction enzyme, S subunit